MLLTVCNEHQEVCTVTALWDPWLPVDAFALKKSHFTLNSPPLSELFSPELDFSFNLAECIVCLI